VVDQFGTAADGTFHVRFGEGAVDERGALMQTGFGPAQTASILERRSLAALARG
jgi:hypothetical protein